MSVTPVFFSPRRFVISIYLHGRGLLLLRSNRTNENSTRIDVLIQDVRAMEMRCWSDGITIEEVGPEFLAGFRSNPAEMIERGMKVYSVSGSDWQGFVLGGIVTTQEGEGDPVGPSSLIWLPNNKQLEILDPKGSSYLDPDFPSESQS
jgi:hypothetical protein